MDDLPIIVEVVDDRDNVIEVVERFRIPPDAYAKWDELCARYPGQRLRVRNKAHVLKRSSD